MPSAAVILCDWTQLAITKSHWRCIGKLTHIRKAHLLFHLQLNDKSILRSFAQMTSSAISTVAEPSVFCGPSLCTADHNGCAVVSDDTVHVLLSGKQWWALFLWQMGYPWARDAILYDLLCLCLAKMFTLRWWFYELVPLYGASLCWCICLEYKRQFDFFHCHSDCSDQNCV